MMKVLQGIVMITAALVSGAMAPADRVGDSSLVRIAFVREDALGRREAWSVAIDGDEDARPILSSAGSGESYPFDGEVVLEGEEALLRGGKVLARARGLRNPAVLGSLVAFESSEVSFRDLFLVRETPEGAQEKERITDNHEGNYEPSFFPDGRAIAFTSSRDGQAEIYRMDLAAVGPRRLATRLTFSAGDDMQPRVSPDGKLIAFLSGRTGTDRVWVMDAHDGANARMLRAAAGVEDDEEEREHVWSPDGTFLLFVARGPKTKSRILRWDVSSGVITALTDSASRGSICDMPKVSPDGRHIAFVKDEDGSGAKPTIWVMRSDGTKARRLVLGGETGSKNWLPSWWTGYAKSRGGRGVLL